MQTMCVMLILRTAVLLPSTFLDTRALIEQALDETPRITLENMRLADAIQQLSEQTGVRVAMAEHIMAFLPHGADTKINKVELAHIPLRRGLVELFGPLGMTFRVMDDHVAIIPKEPIFLLGRTATWDELDLLTKLESLQPGSDPSAAEKLRPLIQFQVFARDPWGDLANAMKTVGAGPADEVLKFACGALGWTWRLSGDKVVVMTLEQALRENLQRPISLRVSSRPLFETLSKVGELANVPIRLESADLAPRIYSLSVTAAPAEQVLAKIAAETGMGYFIESGGVIFYALNREPRPASAAADAAAPVTANSSSTRPRAMIKVIEPLGDGKAIEYLYWEHELPEDLRERREEILRLTIEELRDRARSSK